MSQGVGSKEASGYGVIGAGTPIVQTCGIPPFAAPGEMFRREWRNREAWELRAFNGAIAAATGGDPLYSGSDDPCQDVAKVILNDSGLLGWLVGVEGFEAAQTLQAAVGAISVWAVEFPRRYAVDADADFEELDFRVVIMPDGVRGCRRR